MIKKGVEEIAFYDKVYDAQFYVLFGSKEVVINYPYFKFEESDFKDDILASKGDALCSELFSDQKVYLIWIKKYPENLMDLRIVAHELIHACHKTLSAVHIPLSEDTQEAYAYYYDYLFWEVMKGLQDESIFTDDTEFTASKIKEFFESKGYTGGLNGYRKNIGEYFSMVSVMENSNGVFNILVKDTRFIMPVPFTISSISDLESSYKTFIAPLEKALIK